MNELATVEPELPSWVATLEPAWNLARRLERAREFVPNEFVNRAEAIMAAILTGAELGRGPMWSLRSLHVVNGRPGLAAEAMRALVLAAGHEISFPEFTENRVTITGRRRGEENSTSVTWTIEQAQGAGLLRNAVWRAYPRAMLTARATTELCRLVFADVISGIPTTEELDDGYPLEQRPEPALEPALRSWTPPGASPPVESGGHGGTEAPARSSVAEALSAPPLPGEPGYDLDDEAPAREVHEGDDAPPVDELEGREEPPADAVNERRRFHAAVRKAFPDMTSDRRETYRHALTAVVTRNRETGPTIHYGDTDTTERLELSQRLAEIRAGRVLPSIDADGTVMFSAERRVAVVRQDGDRWTVEIADR